VTLIELNDRPPSNMRSSEPDLRAFATKPSRANVVPISFGKAAEPDKGMARPATPETGSKSAVTSGVEKPESRRLLIATIIFSAAVHAAAIAAAMPRDTGEQFGAVTEKTDTISLSMTQTVVLESISTDVSQMAAAASAASQAGSVQSAESKPQELQEVKDVPVSDQPPPKPIKVADVTPGAVAPTEDPLRVIRGSGEADTASEIKADQIAEKPVEEMPEELETKEDEPEKAKREKEKEVKKERKTAQAESHQQAAGSATSRSSAAQAAVNGRVSASNGNALSYAASIRAQVERTKPSGNGVRGTVRVSFGISPNGELSYVRLSESSGSSNLDDAALAAVRHAAPFGEPPPGLSPTQLAFVIPFYFR
jgi:periplasmic protein TonB